MEFTDELKLINIELNLNQVNQFDIFYNKLIEVNKVMNLTNITEKEEVYFKHFYDCLSLSKAYDFNLPVNVLDVGAGAGFPSIPLAIVYPNAKFQIIDSLNKRITFLNELINELKLCNVCASHARAEEYVLNNREKYDIVTARAVAKLNVLVELCLPFVKVGGLFIAMKGANATDELTEATKGINILGGKVVNVIKMNLPNEYGNREIIIIKKTSATNKIYPRIYKKIKDMPL